MEQAKRSDRQAMQVLLRSEVQALLRRPFFPAFRSRLHRRITPHLPTLESCAWDPVRSHARAYIGAQEGVPGGSASVRTGGHIPSGVGESPAITSTCSSVLPRSGRARVGALWGKRGHGAERRAEPGATSQAPCYAHAAHGRASTPPMWSEDPSRSAVRCRGHRRWWALPASRRRSRLRPPHTGG